MAPYREARPRIGVVAAISAMLLCGCALWRPATVPMPVLLESAGCASRPDTLIVFLPGSFSDPAELVREGLVQAVRARHIAADMALADAHLGYYAERSVVERLRADVVAPALAGGYRHLWLVGISVGAFGGILVADTYPAGIDGVVALGPYLGVRSQTNEGAAAGGLRRWPAPAGPLPPEQGDVAVWRWLKARPEPSALGTAPHVFLGYGLDDRFLVGDELLAAALPAGHALTAPGGHDWTVWRPLRAQILDRTPLQRDASCGAVAQPVPPLR